MNLKKFLTLGLTCVLFSFVAGCTSDGGNSEKGTDKNLTSINVITRENGSGTRSAFTELTGILVKENGTEIDKTSKEAAVQSSTDAVLTTVERDNNAISYISLGSLRDSVKALNIEGVKASAENIKDGNYKLARPFNIAYQNDLSDQKRDFLKFMLSIEGQKIVEKEGYIGLNGNNTHYEATNSEEHITIAGSTSVTPLMEKLVDAYKNQNPKVQIDIQSNGSSAGMTATMKKTADIGMASRDLKAKEKESLQFTTIAQDGIAVIVNKNNKLEDIKIDALKKIFTGEITDFNALK